MSYRSKIANLILDFIFPRASSVILIQNMTAEEIIREIPKARWIDNDESKALFDYKNESTRRAIWEIKYRKNEKLLSVFSEPFYEFILDELADRALFSDFKNPIIVPIPTSKKRLKERGYNQCELIAKEIERIDSGKNFTLSKNILEKIKDSPSQTSVKNRAKRLQNLKGCFKTVNPDEVKDMNIILIDDVITTGATMSEAKKSLMDAGARQVLCFALAH